MGAYMMSASEVEVRSRPGSLVAAMAVAEPTLWVVPWGYDYHGRATLIVIARTADEAKARAREAWATFSADRDWYETPQFEDVRPAMDARVHFDMGCDC